MILHVASVYQFNTRRVEPYYDFILAYYCSSWGTYLSQWTRSSLKFLLLKCVAVGLIPILVLGNMS